MKGKKDNVWSVDNELAQKDKTSKRRPKGRRMVRRKRTKAGGDGRVLVSSAMLVEVETVLQTQVIQTVEFFCLVDKENWESERMGFENWVWELEGTVKFLF